MFSKHKEPNTDPENNDYNAPICLACKLSWTKEFAK